MHIKLLTIPISLVHKKILQRKALPIWLRAVLYLSCTALHMGLLYAPRGIFITLRRSYLCSTNHSSCNEQPWNQTQPSNTPGSHLQKKELDLSKEKPGVPNHEPQGEAGSNVFSQYTPCPEYSWWKSTYSLCKYYCKPYISVLNICIYL